MEIMIQLFDQDAGIAASPYIAAIITGLIRLIGSVIGAMMLRKFNRTMLMVVSAGGMALSISALGELH